MSDTMPQTMQDKMRPLRLNYLRQLHERKGKIERLIALQEQSALSREDRAELKSQAHKLAGTGATYGFPKISEAGRALEDWMDGHSENSRNLLGLTFNLLDVCQTTLQSEPELSDALAQEPTPYPAAGASELPLLLDELPLLLIVDDDEHVLNFLVELFSRDARIVTAVNSSEALKLMIQYMPDLVLLDDMMPGGVSGLRMLEDRKSMPKIRDIPIIMITASKKPEEVMRGLMAGATDYITKPFDPEAVAVKVRSRLKRISTKVLVADDDEAVRELLKHKFHTAGLKVVCAEDGDEAWAILQKQTIALAVLDRMMPGFDGMTLLRKMRDNASSSEIPVIFLTARHYCIDVIEGLNTGAVDYITKPFDPNEVVLRSLRVLKLSNKSDA
jgi:DNA-binding response OmpR family regulator/HPt (histidine-containing phosphotransfer) domain-containing protein